MATKKKKLTRKEIKLAVALQLVKLADGRVKPANSMRGICHNVEKFMAEIGARAWSYYAIPTYAHGWAKHSGDRLYPVRRPLRGVPKNYWTGKYGAARKELCLYIAKKLRSEVRKGNYKIRDAR